MFAVASSEQGKAKAKAGLLTLYFIPPRVALLQA
jgi:hypothetical protein